MRCLFNGKKREFSETLLKILCSFLLLCIVVRVFTGDKTWFHADMAAPFRMAEEMIRTNQVFPDGWIGSTSFFTAVYPIWFFLHFTDDYLVARELTQLVLTGFLLLCMIVACRKTFKNNSWLMCIPVLFSYSSSSTYEMLFVQFAYTVLIATMLLTLGFFSASIKDYTLFTIDRRWAFITSIALSLGCAVSGIIAVQSTLLPLVGSAVLLYVITHYEKTDVRKLPNVVSFSALILVLAVLGLLGYRVSMKLSALSHVVGNKTFSIISPSLEQILSNFDMLLKSVLFYTDFAVGVSFFSLSGIIGLLKLLCFLSFAVVFPILAFKNFKNEPDGMKLFLLFTLIHVAEVFILIICCGVENPIAGARYILSSVVLLEMAGADYFYRHVIKKENLLSWASTAVICLAAAAITIPLMRPCVSYKDTLASMRGLTDFLQSQDLTYGYASFWNAGNNTVLSNGNVQINGIVARKNELSMFYWLTSQDWYDPDYYEGKTFVLLTEEEMDVYAPDGLEYTLLGKPCDTLEYEGFTILVYPYNVSQNLFCGVYDGQRNYLDGFMSYSDESMHQQGQTVAIGKDQRMFGPYIFLGAGEYQLTIKSKYAGEGALVRVTSDSGTEEIAATQVVPGETVLNFSLTDGRSNVEFVIENPAEGVITVQGVYLTEMK